MALTRRLVAALASTLAALGLCEVGARLLLPAPAPLEPRRYVVEVEGIDPVVLGGPPLLRGDVRLDPRLVTQFAPGTRYAIRYDASRGAAGPWMRREGDVALVDVAINADGHRGPRAARPKPAGLVRVVAVGDSFTFGDGVPAEDALPAQLEARLADPGTPEGAPGVEVVNLGVPGLDVLGVAEVVHWLVPALEPDRVLYTVFLNDVPTDASPALAALAERVVAAERTQAAPLTGLAARSRLVGAVTSRRRAAALAEVYAAAIEAGFAPGSAGWELFTRTVRDLRADAEAAGAALTLAIFPVLVGTGGDGDAYPHAGIHARIAAWCAAEGIDCVDLLPALVGHDARTLWVHPTDQHPDPEAHALAAERLARHLAPLLGP